MYKIKSNLDGRIGEKNEFLRRELSKKKKKIFSQFLSKLAFLPLIPVFFVWLVLVIFYFDLPLLVDNKYYDLITKGMKHWNGDIFNVSISFTTLVLAYFAFRVYHLQRKELESLKEELTSIKDEAKISRTMKLYDEWLDNIKGSNEEKINIIRRFVKYYESGLEEHINFRVLSSLLINSGAVDVIYLSVALISDRLKAIKTELNLINSCANKANNENQRDKLWAEKIHLKDEITEMQNFLTFLRTEDGKEFIKKKINA